MCDSGNDDEYGGSSSSSSTTSTTITRDGVHSRLNKITDITKNLQLPKDEKFARIARIIASMEKRSVNQNGVGTYIALGGADTAGPHMFIYYVSDLRGNYNTNSRTNDIWHVAFNVYIDTYLVTRHLQQPETVIISQTSALHGEPGSYRSVSQRIMTSQANPQFPIGALVGLPVAPLTPATAIGGMPSNGVFGMAPGYRPYSTSLPFTSY